MPKYIVQYRVTLRGSQEVTAEDEDCARYELENNVSIYPTEALLKKAGFEDIEVIKVNKPIDLGEK